VEEVKKKFQFPETSEPKSVRANRIWREKLINQDHQTSGQLQIARKLSGIAV